MGKKELKDISLNIFGKNFYLNADEDEEYTHKIAEFLSEEMNQIAKMTGNESYEKIAIIAALNITDKLFQEKEKSKKFEEKLNEILKKIQ